MIQFRFFAVVFLGLFLISSSFSATKKVNKSESVAKTSINKSQSTKDKGTKMQTANARIKTTSGDIVFTFFPDVAPKTTARIQELIKQGFYNGLTFHRVVPGFVIQGGDPTGTGGGGSGQKLPAEFSKTIKHERGSLAMARTSDPNSADSQFYIAMGPFPHLDGQYTIFGKVTEGLDIVEKVKQGDKMIEVKLEQ